MTNPIGYGTESTLAPGEAAGEIAQALEEANRPRHGDSKGPADWLKKNLFNTWYNSIITAVFSVIAAYLAFRIGKFLFSTARWEPVRENTELFLIGRFPREERTRILVQLMMFCGAIGLFAGWIRNRSIRQASEAGVERVTSSWREYLGVYGALGLFFVVALIVGARTINPWLVALGCVLMGVAAFTATIRPAPLALRIFVFVPFLLAAGILTRVSDLDNGKAYGIAAAGTLLLALVAFAKRPAMTLTAALLYGVFGFQALSGTSGLAWLFLAIALAPIILDVVGDFAEAAIGSAAERKTSPIGWIGLALVLAALVWRATTDGLSVVTIVLAIMAVVAANDAVRGVGDKATRLGGIALVGGLGWVIASLLDVPGIDWSQWSGLHLNIVVAAASIVLAFPAGLLLALGRRSQLPVLRALSTVYIELIRGVPLISLLLMGQFFIGFFINSDDPLSNVTRATVAVTMFSAAYIAEIVRGGLQSVAKGQTEAGQALGLAPAGITRLLILPQALRAVIPAMVGQFISLFKDTSLLVIIGITDFLGVREAIHAQEAFRGFGIAETLVFVAFGFWAFSYTMSRESQRLERRLGVGQR